jgi:hypothetical protein
MDVHRNILSAVQGLLLSVGPEPTLPSVLREGRPFYNALTAEFQSEAVRTEKWKSLKARVLHSCSDAPFRMALKKSSYKSSYSPVPLAVRRTTRPEAKDRRKESFDLVRFSVEGDSFRSPVWTGTTEQAVDELIAGTRNVENLIPRRTKAALVRRKGLGR